MTTKDIIAPEASTTSLQKLFPSTVIEVDSLQRSLGGTQGVHRNIQQAYLQVSAPRQIYLIGSLRNPKIPEIGQKIREVGFKVFDDWHAAGPTADDEWKRYELERGHNYPEALRGEAAQHVFNFDAAHLRASHGAVLVLPAGRSGHLELGYMVGLGRPAWIFLDDPDRWDVMYNFATGVHYDLDKLIVEMKGRL